VGYFLLLDADEIFSFFSLSSFTSAFFKSVCYDYFMLLICSSEYVLLRKIEHFDGREKILIFNPVCVRALFGSLFLKFLQVCN
jgi:hypothetical protein